MHKQYAVSPELAGAAAKSLPATEPDLKTDRVDISVRLCNLPPLHTVATQVLSLTADPDIELKRIADVIEMDPAFAAEVLFLANSSLFGFTSRMQVLRHAVAILGLERIKAVSVTVAMRSFLGCGSPSVRQCWQHSAACAFICEKISHFFKLPPGQAYTAGLMHDIGRLGLLKTYPELLGPILRMSFTNPEELRRAERTVLAIDHATAGGWLVKAWALPPAFHTIAKLHHEEFQKGDPDLLALVKTSCLMANALGYSPVRYSRFPTYQAVRKAAPVKGRNHDLPDEGELRSVVETKLKAFE